MCLDYKIEQLLHERFPDEHCGIWKLCVDEVIAPYPVKKSKLGL